MDARFNSPDQEETSGTVLRFMRYVALTAVAIVVVIANIVLFRQIDIQLERSYTAETDSTPWVLSQVEVELLRYISALHALEDSGHHPDLLAQLRLQYDLLYSRVQLINRHSRLTELSFTKQPDWLTISGQDGLVQRAMPLMDGPDDELLAAIPGLRTEAEAATQAIRGDIVRSMLESIRKVEVQRSELRSSLQVFSAVSLGLMGIMAALVITIYLQSRARERHRDELAQAVFNLRTTIDSSLEAVVIFDHDGRVVGCNRAGAEMFDWSDSENTVRYLTDVLRDSRRGGQGLADLIKASQDESSRGQGRINLTGTAKNGRTFPLELSIAQARSAVGLPIAIAFLRDISERVEREQALQQARNSALQGEEAKSRFLAIMSHEMRTPLSGLLSAVEVLRNETTFDERQGWLLRVIENCGRTTLEQVNNVLDLTRLGAPEKQREQNEVSFSLQRLVEEVVAQFEVEAQQRGNRMTTQFTGIDLPEVRAQRALVLRILVNLVSNAVKFTEKGAITIGVDAQPGRGADSVALRISVTDTGIGIHDADRDRIFNMFETLDASFARLRQGSGLGLGLAKLAAEAMGGRITVASRMGEGSTFALFLTLKRAPKAEPRLVVTPRQPEVLRPAGSSGVNILVVEDNPINQVLLATILERDGHSVQLAGNGAEGVDVASKQRFDVILMDVMMPVMDGLEASKRIRAEGPSAKSPIVAITANAGDESTEVFQNAGMTHVMCKPVSMKDLREVISMYADVQIEKLSASDAPAQAAPAPEAPVAEAAPAPAAQPAATGDAPHLRLVASNDAGPAAEVAAPEPRLPDDLPPLLDEEIFSDLEQSLGAEYMSRMTSRFVAETDVALADMGDRSSAGDLSGAAQVAHKNAGAAASLGLAALHKLFVVYETQAKAGDGGSAEQTKMMIDRIKRETFDLLREKGLTA